MSLEKLMKNSDNCLWRRYVILDKRKYFEGANSEITCMPPNKN